MGSILPVTGQLSAYGSGMQEAGQLAVDHMNEAGGPLGREISFSKKDSETQPSRAVQKYNTLVDEDDIVGFVGASSSGVSVSIAENVASDGVMQVSNASTSPVLATMGYPEGQDSPKYFARTAPNDGQQGIVMGKILNDDEYVGADSAAFLFVDNAYGEGLANKAAEAFDGTVTSKVGYSAQTQDYSSTLDSLFADDPDAVGFVGYPENGRTILQQWSDGGYGGDWVLSEGLNSEEFFKELSDIVAGMYVSSPDPESGAGATAFEDAMGDANTLFAAHTYDAMFLQGLAIHKAGEASGEAIANNIRSVSRGSDATTVTVNEFQKAKDALDNGDSINYQGASSPVDMNEKLEPLNPFAIIQIQDDGSRETLESIPRSFFDGKL